MTCPHLPRSSHCRPSLHLFCPLCITSAPSQFSLFTIAIFSNHVWLAPPFHASSCTQNTLLLLVYLPFSPKDVHSFTPCLLLLSPPIYHMLYLSQVRLQASQGNASWEKFFNTEPKELKWRGSLFHVCKNVNYV